MSAEQQIAEQELAHAAVFKPAHFNPDEPRYKLLTSAAILALPRLKWRVKGVVPANGIAALFGPSASGKSFLAFDMAVAIAEGITWFGYRVEPAPVVYVCLEGEAGFGQRVKAWQVANHRGLPAGLHMVLQPFRITFSNDVEELAQVVPKGAVVFVDTLNRAAPTADENASKDMGQIIEGAKSLQTLTGGVVILVHHTGKNVQNGMRGHSSLFSAMDATIEVQRNGESRTWRADKEKDAADGQGHAFKLQVVELGEDDDGDPITSCVVAEDKSAVEIRCVKSPQGSNQIIAAKTLKPLFEDGSTGKLGAPLHRPCIKLEDGISAVAERLTCETSRRNSRARSTVTAMVANGLLGCNEGWLWFAA